MKRRLVIYAALAAAIAGALIFNQWKLTHAEKPAPSATAGKRPTGPRASELPDPCLGPDVRLLQAVGEVHRIMTATAFEPAVARFEAGQWHLTHRGVEVGAVPELPDFADMTGLLSSWARRLGVESVYPGQPALENAGPALDQLGRMHAVLAAAECDRLAGKGVRNAALLALGARTLVMLELQTTDEVGIADRVAARALALVAASQAIDSTAVSREACLLAHRMGYGAWAWSAAERLPEDDPIRLYVREEDDRLAAVAARRGAGAESRFLRLVRVARERDQERWADWLGSAFSAEDAMSLPALGTGFAVRQFETRMPAAYLVFLTVAQELRMLDAYAGPDSTTRDTPPLATFVRGFEGIMGDMSPGADGLFLDRDLLRAYYRGSFYTALYSVGEHYRSGLSSVPATQEFATGLAALPEGPAAEFGRWYTHLADAKGGNAQTAELRKDIARTTSFGAPLLLRTFQEIRRGASYGSLQPRYAAVALARRLDSRPEHRLQFGNIAGHDLLMLPLGEKLTAGAASASSPLEEATQGWWAQLNGDRARIETLLAQHGLTADQQAVLLTSLRAVAGRDSATMCAAYQRCMAQHPGSWRLVDAFVDYASLDLKAYPLSRAALERWLARNRRRDNLEVVVATASLARTYEREGRWAEALRVVEPVARSQQYGAMAGTAMGYEHVGRAADAETLAVFAWQRYPDSPDAQSLVAEIFWRHGKYDVVAEALADQRFRLSPNDWRWTLAPRFVASFKDRDAEAMKAVAALERPDIPGNYVVQLATGCGNNGRRDLAFEILQRVRLDGMEAVARIYHSYYQLKRWKDQPAAVAWIRPHMDKLGAQERALITYEAYRNGDPELLWEVGKVPEGLDGEFHWLMRAATSLRWRDADPAHERELTTHFAQSSDDRYRTLGRFLRGLEAESTVLALADGGDHVCEVQYYLGLKAQSEGRYRDAAECYARAVATSQAQEGEFRWAMAQLEEWRGKNLTLAKLAETDREQRAEALVAGGEETPSDRGD
jgi:tetratricopeptide (TPR) repeat protein